MIDAHHYSTFLLAALVLAVLPGPGLLYVLARSLGGGRRDGVHSSFGTLVGGMVHVFASAVGLSALILASSLAFSVVKYAGAAYLIYLGVRTLLSREQLHLDVEGVRGQNHAFRQGIVTELLNPKTALFFLAFIPQFVNPDAGACSGSSCSSERPLSCSTRSPTSWWPRSPDRSGHAFGSTHGFNAVGRWPRAAR